MTGQRQSRDVDCCASQGPWERLMGLGGELDWEDQGGVKNASQVPGLRNPGDNVTIPQS